MVPPTTHAASPMAGRGVHEFPDSTDRRCRTQHKENFAELGRSASPPSASSQQKQQNCKWSDHITIWPPSIKSDHGSTSWLTCLFNCCSVACGCRDRCGRNNLCHKSSICVWSLVCWSCCAPFCRPFCIHQLLFPCPEVLVQSASPHYAFAAGETRQRGMNTKEKLTYTERREARPLSQAR